MKLVLTILFFISLSANATNYYVSNSGSDAANGLTTGTAWQTLAKINSTSFSSGDSIFLNRGDTWNERLTVPSSNIYIGAYGTGNKPLITAFQTVTGLTDSSHVWSATIPNSVADLNTVLVNGTIRAKGRYPNTGYLNFTSIVSRTQLSTPLSGTPNYSGSDVIVRCASWILDRSRVLSQSGGTLMLRDSLTYGTPYSNGYFFQNSLSFLDQDGEWYFDSTNKKIYVYWTSLTAPSVQISTIDTLAWVNNKSNVSFSNLSIQGANKAAFQVDTSRAISIINCSVNNSGALGISALKSPLLNIFNDSIQNCLSGAIYARQVDPYTPTINTCDSATISGNYISKTAIFPGMGLNSNGRYFSIYVIGLSPLINNNVVDSTGYVPIFFNGKKSLVKNNIVSNFCFVKDDGGGIYTVIGGYLPSDYNDSSKIISNIVYNGIGVTGSGAPGIYLDDGTRLVTVDSNTIFNATEGIKVHNNTSNIFTNNKLFNNITSGFRNQPEVNVNQNILFKYNQIYSSLAGAPFYITQNILSTSNLGILSDNYYSHTYDESKIVQIASTNYSLSAWQSYSGRDLNSKGTPSSVTGATALLKYNPTFSAQTYALTGTYIDITGNPFNNSITLQPFTSAILFKAITDIIPKYQLKFRRIKR